MKLTGPQRTALDALADADTRMIEARVSNRTAVEAFGVSIYWQTADNLTKKGLASQDARHTPMGVIRITDAGRELLAANEEVA